MITTRTKCINSRTIILSGVFVALVGGVSTIATAQPHILGQTFGQVVGQSVAPLVRDHDPLLPDAFNPPRSLVFVTRDDPAFVRFLGRVRPTVDIEVAPRTTDVKPDGVAVIDGNDSDRDGYIEYYDGGAYVAELKHQGAIDMDPTLLRFAGIVREQYVATFDGYREPRLLLRLQHASGKHALVDAGPSTTLAKLGIANGDTVEVVAKLGLVNDKPALIADQVKHEENTVKVVRAPSAD